MKKFIVIIAALCFGLKAEAQEFGTLQYQTFNNVKKGANWEKRPEAKFVYEGSEPPGIEIVVLDDDYFVMFSTEPGESNPLDRNYILFRKGQKIYYKGGECIAAYCGNKIISLKRANRPAGQPGPVPPYVKRDTIYEETVVKRKIYAEEEPSYAGGPINNEHGKNKEKRDVNVSIPIIVGNGSWNGSNRRNQTEYDYNQQQAQQQPCYRLWCCQGGHWENQCPNYWPRIPRGMPGGIPDNRRGMPNGIPYLENSGYDPSSGGGIPSRNIGMPGGVAWRP